MSLVLIFTMTEAVVIRQNMSNCPCSHSEYSLLIDYPSIYISYVAYPVWIIHYFIPPFVLMCKYYFAVIHHYSFGTWDVQKYKSNSSSVILNTQTVLSKCHYFARKGPKMLQLINFMMLCNSVSLSCQQSICQSRYCIVISNGREAHFGKKLHTEGKYGTQTQTMTICSYFQHLSPQINLLGQSDSSWIPGIRSCTLTQRHDKIHESNHLAKEHC